MTTAHQAGQDPADMFHNVVAGVLTGVLDDQTDRDMIALAKELVAPAGRLTLLHLHLVTAKPARDSGSLADMASAEPRRSG